MLQKKNTVSDDWKLPMYQCLKFNQSPQSIPLGIEHLNSSTYNHDKNSSSYETQNNQSPEFWRCERKTTKKLRRPCKIFRGKIFRQAPSALFVLLASLLNTGLFLLAIAKSFTFLITFYFYFRLERSENAAVRRGTLVNPKHTKNTAHVQYCPTVVQYTDACKPVFVAQKKCEFFPFIFLKNDKV